MGLSIVVKQLMVRSGIVFIVKIIGAIIRIPLFRWLGAEGVGLYQMIYSVYGLILTLVTGGIPTALSLETAKDRKQGLRMLNVSIIFVMLLGGVTGIIMRLYAAPLARLLGDSQLTWSILFISPAIFIVPIVSLIRSFLQGIEAYGAIAVSELIEQVFRVLTIVIFVSLWMNHSRSLAVGGAVLGAVVGAIAALLFLVVVLFAHLQKNYPTTKRNNMRIITFPLLLLVLNSSLTLAASRLIIPLADFLDALIIPHRLHEAGFTVYRATSIYGEFTGMASSIVYLPTLMTSALAYILSSKITFDWKSGLLDRFNRRCRMVLHVGWLWGMGSGVFFFYYHNDLSQLIFGNNSASLAICYMAFAPLFGGMRELSTIILWGKENRRLPLVGLFVSLIISVLFGYTLITLPGMSYIGVAFELLSLECIAALWNLWNLKKSNGSLFSVFFFIKESGFISLVAVICFQAIHFLVNTLHWTGLGHSIVEICLSYCCISGFIMIRILRKYRYKVFVL